MLSHHIVMLAYPSTISVNLRLEKKESAGKVLGLFRNRASNDDNDDWCLKCFEV